MDVGVEVTRLKLSPRNRSECSLLTSAPTFSTIFYFVGTTNFVCIAATICAQVEVVDALFTAATPLA